MRMYDDELWRRKVNRRMFTAVALSVLIAASAYAQTTPLLDWPRFRGANGDGVSIETNWNAKSLRGDARILWKANVGTGFSSVVIENDRLYTIGLVNSDNIVFCLDASTGKLIWKTALKGWAPPQTTPTVDGDHIYCVTQSSTVYCLNTASGETIWNSHELQTGMPPSRGQAASPVVAGSLLILNGNSEGIALDRDSGALKWRILDDPPKDSWGSIATPLLLDIGGFQRAIFLGPSSLYAADIASGKKLWSYSYGYAKYIEADVVSFADSFFVSLPDKCMLVQVSNADPKVIWINSELTTWLSAPVLIDGYLYGSHIPPELSSKTFQNIKGVKTNLGVYISTAAFKNSLDELKTIDLPFRCVEWKTGKVVWEKNLKYSFLTTADGKLIMQELNGTIHVAEATPFSYKEIATSDIVVGKEEASLFATPPVLCNGRLYFRNYAGDLVCIDMKE
jgi:outer membrane protein assembly factor BamB